MALLENGQYIPDRFQPVPSQEDQLPTDVICQTAELLDLYFGENLVNPFYVQQHLGETTSGYLDSAEQGFFMRLNPTAKLRRRELEEILRDSTWALARPNPHSSTAFAHTVVVFSLMPDLFKPDTLVKKFSRGGTLRPPQTTIEYLIRVRELRHEVKKIVCGDTTPQAIVEGNPPLLRTYAYFKVGSEIPLKMSANEWEIREVNKNLNRLLEGVDISL